jgi:thiosulfate dehydrogenase (quinone) large subunit
MNYHLKLRAVFALAVLFLGIGKFMGGVGNFAGGTAQHFAGKLPAALVLPFCYALPFAEVILGALILLGLFDVFALSLSGLLLVALTFGTVMRGDPPTFAHNVQYALVNFVLLSFADYNGYLTGVANTIPIATHVFGHKQVRNVAD